MTDAHPPLDLGPEKGLTPQEIEDRIEKILSEASLEEKAGMMSGRGFFQAYAAAGRRWGASPYRAGGGVERLGVPPLYFTDGPRGAARGSSTCFPCTMGRGASFDVDLERRIGEAMAVEVRAQGCTLSGAVCINLLRHPAWGRAQETYGEDPLHLGEMGAALATGLQTHNVVATVKHFALNSMENARFTVNVICDGQTMREVYLPHFKRVIDAGCLSVMSAYNQWNGEYCGQHRELLTDILRREWGFEGFVHSDWVFGLRHVYAAPAGLDVENPEPIIFGPNLVAAAQTGAVAPEVIDTACRRILTAQYRLACAQDPFEVYDESLVASAEHRALAREAATKAAVLLKNEGALPFDPRRVKTLAVLGLLADLENTGDRGSSNVRPPYVVTPAEGLRRRLGSEAVLLATEDDPAGVAAACRAADAIVVVVGYTHKDEGEYVPGGGIDLGQIDNPAMKSLAKAQARVNPGPDIGGDRASLNLPAAQIAMIKTAAAAAQGKPLVVVIVAGSAVLVEDWLSAAPAILQSFYAGMEGGEALADLLFGDASPSGRLPFTVAKAAQDYPFFDAGAKTITYGPYHGYTLLDRDGKEPRYGFGHGLSYAAFSYRALKVRRVNEAIAVQVSVRNDGSIAADEVVLAFVRRPPVGEGPVRRLRAFARVALQPGEQKTVLLRIPLSDLRRWDDAARTWRDEAGEHVVEILPRIGSRLEGGVRI
jgi:beta-glucosidase